MIGTVSDISSIVAISIGAQHRTWDTTCRYAARLETTYYPTGRLQSLQLFEREQTIELRFDESGGVVMHDIVGQASVQRTTFDFDRQSKLSVARRPSGHPPFVSKTTTDWMGRLVRLELSERSMVTIFQFDVEGRVIAREIITLNDKVSRLTLFARNGLAVETVVRTPSHVLRHETYSWTHESLHSGWTPSVNLLYDEAC